MKKFLAVASIAIAALLLSVPVVDAEAADPTTERDAIRKVMHDYFEAYSCGDMAVVISFIGVPVGAKGLYDLYEGR